MELKNTMQAVQERIGQLEQRYEQAANRRERLLKLALEDYISVVSKIDLEYANEVEDIFRTLREYVIANVKAPSS